MQVGLTNPLREFLGRRPFGPWEDEVDPIFCWDAHRVMVDGRVMLVVCNAANRFAGVTAIRGADWRRIEEKCEELVEQAMLAAGFSEIAVGAYMELAGEVDLGRTHGRKPMGCMNRMVDTLMWCECERGEQLQRFLMHVVNDEDLCHCATREDYGTPTAWMAEDLLALGIDPHAQALADGDPIPAIIGAPAPMDDGGWAPVDIIAKSSHLFPPEQDERVRELNARIAAAERAMIAERGFEVPHAAGCRVCGAEPRVHLDSDDYCLACYNELIERLMGIPRVTNDQSTLAVFGPGGEVIQFEVERIVTPIAAEWVAQEAVDDDDPRRAGGYVGIEVNTFVDPAGDQDEALAGLWEKAQQAVDHPSTRAEGPINGIEISNGAHVGGETRFAEERGWGRIDEHRGEYCIVVDGQRYTGDQFLELMSGYIGFNLVWGIADRTDPLPEIRD